MLAFFIRRIAVCVLVALIVTLITFLLLRFSGDPAVAIAGEGASAADVERVRVEYGFNEPVWVSYSIWLGNVLTGNLGYSHILKTDVGSLVLGRLPITLSLTFVAMTVALLIAIPLAVIGGSRPGSLVDRLGLLLAAVSQSLPSFWLGLTLALYFGLNWRLLPTAGDSTWAHYVLPGITLGLAAVPALLRITRAGVMGTLQSDFVRTARAKGVSNGRVLLRHCIPNAIIPTVSLTAVILGQMLAGSIVIEAVFSMNGLGQLAWQAVQRSDTEVIQGVVLLVSCLYVLLTLFADIINYFVDPRLRSV